MFKVKALALATLVQMTSAATEFSVDWGEWKSANEGQKGKKPVKSWKKIGGSTYLLKLHASDNVK